MTPPTVTEYVLEAVAHIVDGDTFDALVSRTVGEIDGWEITATKVVRLRLIHLDTPERGEPGYHEATADLAGWLYDHTGHDTVPQLVALVQDKPDSFGRFLADVYRPGDRASTASDFMVRERHWDVWMPARSPSTSP